MAVFTLIPFSAENYYINHTLTASDFITACYSNSTFRALYSPTPSQNNFISIFGDVSGTGYRRNAPYNMDLFVNGNELYSQGVIFTSDNIDKYITLNLTPFFDLYFDNFDLEFYLITFNVPTVEVQYLDSDSNLVSVSIDREIVRQAALSVIYSEYSDIISSQYYSYVSNNPYYTDASGNANQITVTGTTFRLVKITAHFTNLNKTNIDAISIYVNNFSSNDSAVSPRIFPYLKVISNINCYVLSSQDDIYNQQFANQQQIIAQQQQIINQLEEMNGPPSHQQQQQIDNIENQLATESDELQEQLDIIDSVELPTELPTMDTSDLENQTSIIHQYVGNLDLLNIFNVIVPAGCAGFLIYVVLRRF